jgi:Transposase DDE domain
MDRTIWKIAFQAIHQAHRHLPGPRRRPQYPDWLIVAMFLWSVWHHRPLSWACQRGHYGDLFRPRKIPSVSQFTRRIKTSRCQQILQQVHDQLAKPQVGSFISYLDGKAMLVSPVSKDKDARRGRVSGGFAKGYKLHVWATADDRIPLWGVTSLNTGECPVAEQLCLRMPMLPDDSLVMADGNYDSKDLHNLIAWRNGRLLAPPKGMAKHPVTLRQMGPVRREALVVWRESESLAKQLLRRRIAVENIFSRICELSRLPAWVRGLRRVTRWVGGVLILYHARLQTHKTHRAEAA